MPWPAAGLPKSPDNRTEISPEVSVFEESDQASAERLIGSAARLQEQGDVQRSIEVLDRALKLDPSNAQAYYHRANARSSMGDLDEAIFDYSAAIRLDPEMADAYLRRGVSQSRLRRFRGGSGGP